MPWETIGDSIRHRLRDPDDFKAGSFRYITLKKDKPRVFGIIGILKGQTTTTLQALRFPIGDGWTVAAAKEWTKKHFGEPGKEFVMSAQHETKRLYVEFDVKTITEAGHFEGLSSVYGNIDLGNDIVEPGAFTKTIQEHGSKVPLLTDHRESIGLSNLEDRPEGLYTFNQLNLAKSVARDAYADLKFYFENGIKMGMSIGYKVVQWVPDKVNEAIRHLTEVKLWENSITLFPMNQLARVQAVKSAEDDLSALITEIKAGRMFSESNMQQMRDMLSSHGKLIEDHTALIEKFRALLESGNKKPGAAKGANEGPDNTTPDEHSIAGPEDLHAALEQFKSNLRSSIL